jgi:hypothetical protein
MENPMKNQHSKFFVAMIACLLLGGSAAIAQSRDGENRVVKVVNETSRPIYHLYVSNVDTEYWGADQLGLLETIDPNHYMKFNMDDGTGHCLYDIKAVVSDGKYAVRRHFNVCTGESWTITN